MLSSYFHDNSSWRGLCSLYPIRVSLLHLYPWGWDRWKGLLACLMLDALLHAGPISLPDCLIAEPQTALT